MARNEEKQQGRLNRLWLQKEREVGRLKDARDPRPKLYTLNTSTAVKKWIPSIKNEMEYYLQQSQLTHYPERKIAEFHLKIEALEKEYKSFITKLRMLDPSCKHQPWTPRAYKAYKRRADKQESHCAVKKPHATFIEGGGELNEDISGGRSCTGNLKTFTREALLNNSETRKINQALPNLDSPDQDLPLCFDQSRLAVAVAPFRGAAAALGLTKTNNLARVLQSGLPNLGNSAMTYSSHQNLTNRNQRLKEPTKSDECRYSMSEKPQCAAQKRHLLGLDCYSSSDEEDNAG
ncbi:hypothetical protein NQD34_002339 [Periophthalmus magnuspinnatus]|uniref:uncharacterized protein si:dkey-86e18.1 n=1 Tax=Periophthalmus magnuspinnatus TaxID=409849 RepID=UPI00145BAF0C|nr:uncharacterized protein si:dkey-86e18.1 [Periophthalmus magnuspinnatus]KAJ0032258.1 hypothetical protein NQD34_002339 [Periophthalmus magnuspinnatus]